MTTPQDLRDQCQLYLLGVLEGEELNEMERLVSEGGLDVLEGLREAAIANATIVALCPQAEPPRRLRARILASVGVAPAVSARTWNWAWAAATAVLVIAWAWTGVDSARKGQELAAASKAASDARSLLAQTREDLTRVSAALRFLDQPETKLVGFGSDEPAPPRGNVFVNPKSGVLLVASNLPQLANDKTYQLWMIPKNGNPLPAGLFRSDASGIAVHLRTGQFDSLATGAVAVTVEPGGGSPQPTSTPIIVARLVGP